MNGELRFVEASQEEHFRAMSLIHALGWRDTYVDAVPADFMSREITDDRWVDVFRSNYEGGEYHGLLLYCGEEPVSCINFGPARQENYNPGEICIFQNENYAGWGEITSFYTHPDYRAKGYGGLLLEEACRRLKKSGHEHAFVFVLRENAPSRRFYERYGFTWDGTHQDIPFPPDTICVDLRYCKEL